MRIVFCGSGPFAVVTLERLLATGHEIVSVWTNPDRPAGRGAHLHATPVKDRALAHALPVYQPASLLGEAVAEHLKALAPALGVVVAYGHLIPGALLPIPANGFINLHASILPGYRGAAPVPHAILAGEVETGVTVFRLNERFDEGDILGIERTPIGPEDTSATVLERLAPIGADLVRTVIGEFAAGWAQPIPQDDGRATRAPKLTKEMGQIDWQRTGAEIDRQSRAFQPWPLAFTFVHGQGDPVRLVVLAVEEAPRPERSAVPGTVVIADGKAGLAVATGDGALWLRRVKPAGRKEMSGAEYVRGARLTTGLLMA